MLCCSRRISIFDIYVIFHHSCFAHFITFQEKSEEAQHIQMRALRVYKKAPRPQHPSVANACNGSSLCMGDQVAQERSKSIIRSETILAHACLYSRKLRVGMSTWG